MKTTSKKSTAAALTLVSTPVETVEEVAPNAVVGSPLVDNFDDTFRAIAKFICENAPPGIRQYNLDQLTTSALPGNDPDSSISLEFKRDIADTQRSVECTLYVRSPYYSGESFDAPDGSLWREMARPDVQVSWPSYGSSDLGITSARLGLMKEVTDFAHLVQSTFSTPLYKCVFTVEQRAQNEKNRRERELTGKVQRLVEDAPEKKGSRLGVAFLCTHKDWSTVPAGQYVARIGKSLYEVKVPTDLTDFAVVTRVSTDKAGV